jgi:hypothetical protein
MDSMLFILAVSTITLLAVVIFVKNPVSYFKSKEGKKVAVGIILAILISAGISIIFPHKAYSFEYFSSAEVYAGLDYTKKLSPMCDVGVNNDKLTSNLGLKVSAIASQYTSVNLKYTHHSCAVNPDHLSYDAAGVEVVYKLW